MPSISFFYGIVITMYFDDHNPPHFHAKYQGHEAEFSFDGTLLNGKLPEKQTRMVQAWAAIHEDDLITNWELLEAQSQPEKIDPLR